VVTDQISCFQSWRI